MTKEETLRLALDTLKEVREETFRLMRNGERLYSEDKVWSTIISIKEVLAQPDTPKHEWVWLTDEQILHLVDTHVGAPSMDYPLDNSDWINFARAIEAAHGIKETP